MAGQGVEDADERVLHQLMDFSYRRSPTSWAGERHQLTNGRLTCDRQDIRRIF
jgi:hypothetical protein